MAELHALSETKAMNDEKMWKSSKEGIAKIKAFTDRFMKFLRRLSLELSDHPTAIQGASSNRYLSEKSVVLPGKEIFSLFFTGTKGDDLDDDGNPYK